MSIGQVGQHVEVGALPFVLLVVVRRTSKQLSERPLLYSLLIAAVPSPRIAPARGPPLWEAAAAAEQAENDPQWDQAAQPTPEIEFDQRIAW